MMDIITYTKKQELANERIRKKIVLDLEKSEFGIKSKENIPKKSNYNHFIEIETIKENNLTIENIDLSLIDENPFQTRHIYDEGNFELLLRSIKARGLINPITLLKSDDRYYVVSGHRRFRVFKRLKLKSIPAIIKINNNHNELTIDLAHENLIRDDLLPIEKADTIKLLISHIDSTENDLNKIYILLNLLKNYKKRGYLPKSRKQHTKDFSDNDVLELNKLIKSIGLTENSCVRYLKLLELPDYIQEKISYTKGSIKKLGTIGLSEGEELARIDDKAYQNHIFNKIISGTLRGRGVKSLANQYVMKKLNGEWKGFEKPKINYTRKFKDDIDKLNILTENTSKLNKQIRNFKIDTLQKLETTLEEQDFIQNAEFLKTELELLLINLNDKIRSKGYYKITKKLPDFEIDLLHAKEREGRRFSFPMKQVKLLNLNPDSNYKLKINLKEIKELK